MRSAPITLASPTSMMFELVTLSPTRKIISATRPITSQLVRA